LDARLRLTARTGEHLQAFPVAPLEDERRTGLVDDAAARSCGRPARAGELEHREHPFAIAHDRVDRQRQTLSVRLIERIREVEKVVVSEDDASHACTDNRIVIGRKDPCGSTAVPMTRALY